MKRLVASSFVVIVSLAFVTACTKSEEKSASGAGGEKTLSPAVKDAADAAKATTPPPAPAGSRMSEFADVASLSFGLDKLKAAAGSLSTDDLKSIAAELVETIQGESGSVGTLKEQLAKLSPTDLAGMAELKKSLGDTDALLADLRAKLAVVVDALKAKGVNVSQYTSLLTGK